MTASNRLADQPWTPTQDAQLRLLARANTPTHEIAVRMGRTSEAVFQRAFELGVIKRTGAVRGDWRVVSNE